MTTDGATWTPTLVGTVLADVAPEAVVWRSHGRLAHGKVTILDGDPGLGKSTLAMDWAARITRGVPLPDGPAERPRGVILISAEDDPADTIRPRFDAAGGDASQVLILNEVPGANGTRLFELPTDCALLETMIRARDVAFVVIDPFVGFLAEQLKSTSDQDIRRALSPVALVAQRTGASILLLRHLNKSGGDNALYRGGGSIGIIGVARFGLLIAADPENPEDRVLASTKCNLSRAPPNLSWRLISAPDSEVAIVDWLGASGYSAGELLSASADTEERAERDEAREWLRSLLAEGPLGSNDVHTQARKAGFSERALKRAKATLRVHAERTGFGREGSWSWRLPKEDTSSIDGQDDSIGGHHEKPYEMPKADIGVHRGTPNGTRARGEYRIYVCLGCGIPRSRSADPCPACGETRGEERTR